MLGLSVPATLSLKLPHLLQPVLSKPHVESMAVKTRRTQVRKPVLFTIFHHQSLSNRAVLARVGNDGGGSVDANPYHSTPRRYGFPTTMNVKVKPSVARSTFCFLKVEDSSTPQLLSLDISSSGKIVDLHSVPNDHNIDIPIISHAASNFSQRLVLADLDPATAKLAIGILGPFLSAFSFLFIVRIVMSWYPKLPVGRFPYVLAYAPTEPLLVVTRKVIPPLGGVDVTPVVWFGLVSFLNEILVGPQGLLVLVSQQVS